MAGRPLGAGPGWSVTDVLCTAGPADRPYEEFHARVAVGMVVGGSFSYRSPAGRSLMTPGSLLLGNHGQCFECGHRHAAGDRCVSFSFAPEYFERVAADAGVPAGARSFRTAALPPLRATAPLVALAAAAVSGAAAPAWEEVAI